MDRTVMERIFDGMPVLGNTGRRTINVTTVDSEVVFVPIPWGDETVLIWKPF